MPSVRHAIRGDDRAGLDLSGCPRRTGLEGCDAGMSFGRVPSDPRLICDAGIYLIKLTHYHPNKLDRPNCINFYTQQK